MNTFNYATAVVAVVNHERRTARLEGTYDGLATYFSLTTESESATITDAARTIVVEGAHRDGTKVGETITEDMLTGRDPGTGAAHRDYWKAARAVRIGLVAAIKRAAGDDGDDDTESVVNLLTRAGLKAELEDVIAAWKLAHASA